MLYDASKFVEEVRDDESAAYANIGCVCYPRLMIHAKSLKYHWQLTNRCAAHKSGETEREEAECMLSSFHQQFHIEVIVDEKVKDCAICESIDKSDNVRATNHLILQRRGVGMITLLYKQDLQVECLLKYFDKCGYSDKVEAFSRNKEFHSGLLDAMSAILTIFNDALITTNQLLRERAPWHAKKAIEELKRALPEPRDHESAVRAYGILQAIINKTHEKLPLEEEESRDSEWDIASSDEKVKSWIEILKNQAFNDLYSARSKRGKRKSVARENKSTGSETNNLRKETLKRAASVHPKRASPPPNLPKRVTGDLSSLTQHSSNPITPQPGKSILKTTTTKNRSRNADLLNKISSVPRQRRKRQQTSFRGRLSTSTQLCSHSNATSMADPKLRVFGVKDDNPRPARLRSKQVGDFL